MAGEDLADSLDLVDLVGELVGLVDLEDLVDLVVGLVDLVGLEGYHVVLQDCQANELVNLVNRVCSDLLADLQGLVLL